MSKFRIGDHVTVKNTGWIGEIVNKGGTPYGKAWVEVRFFRDKTRMLMSPDDLKLDYTQTYTPKSFIQSYLGVPHLNVIPFDEQMKKFSAPFEEQMKKFCNHWPPVVEEPDPWEPKDPALVESIKQYGELELK